MRAKQICTIGRSYCVLASIIIAAIIYNIPTFFEFTYISETGEAIPSQFRANPMYQRIYKTYMYVVFLILIPVGTMIVLNSMIARAVHIAYRNRKTMSGREEKERRITIMVLVVIIVFIVLNSLAFVANFIEAFELHREKLEYEIYLCLIALGNILVVFNSAINFIIYCALGFRFRQMFMKIFCPCFYDPAKEYRFLSVKYGSDRSNVSEASGAGFGIISMRRLPPKSLQISDQKSLQTINQPNGGSSSSANAANSSPFDYSRLRQSQRIKIKEAEQYD